MYITWSDQVPLTNPRIHYIIVHVVQSNPYTHSPRCEGTQTCGSSSSGLQSYARNRQRSVVYDASTQMVGTGRHEYFLPGTANICMLKEIRTAQSSEQLPHFIAC